MKANPFTIVTKLCSPYEISTRSRVYSHLPEVLLFLNKIFEFIESKLRKITFSFFIGLECGSVLFRHEVAFVLGQLQSPLTVQSLVKVVEDMKENEIVRHESIEALGSIGTETCMEIIRRYLTDDKALVRESCEVALDMCDYENSIEFQYANGLEIVSKIS